MRLLNSKFYYLKQLTHQERYFCMQSVFWLLLVKTALCLFPYSRTIYYIQAWSRNTHKVRTKKDILPSDMCILIEKCAYCLPLSLKCLSRALTGYVLCRRSGHPVYLRIGAKRSSDGNFCAHAWLELNDVIIMGNLPDIHSFSKFRDFGSQCQKI